ncbi:hypothetical protein [Streptomyces tanashiensis]|uniref:Uncharacterized protein n=1 Tax=Streptomyces tanashiensis TaxID=67367 RepID=A0ABY6R4E9_9ACTN|nr:hypothetical protein [Streptomyces tanashiensis]UZX24651.1 hypothetical protein LDH80_29845 [Streptomyces tanashiensis]
MLAQPEDGRHGSARAVGHDRDPGGGERGAGAVEFGVVDVAEGVGVADGDPAAEAEGGGAGGDVPQLGGAGLAAVVEVQVDALAVAFGEAEDGVELAGRVAVEAHRVEAADEVGAVGQRGVEELGDAGRGDDPGLREGDELDAEPVAERLADVEEGVQVVEAGVGVDVDVGADVSGAEGDHPAGEGGGPLGDGHLLGAAGGALGGDLLVQAGGGPVRAPGGARTGGSCRGGRGRRRGRAAGARRRGGARRAGWGGPKGSPRRRSRGRPGGGRRRCGRRGGWPRGGRWDLAGRRPRSWCLLREVRTGGGGARGIPPVTAAWRKGNWYTEYQAMA